METNVRQLIGERLLIMIRHCRAEAAELRAKADELEAAWSAWDLDELMRLRILTLDEADEFVRETEAIEA